MASVLAEADPGKRAVPAELRGVTLICFSPVPWELHTARPCQLMRRFGRSARVLFWQPARDIAGLREPRLDVRSCAETGVTTVTPELPADAGGWREDMLKRSLGDLLGERKGPLVRWYATPDMLAFSRHIPADCVIYDRVEAQVDGAREEADLELLADADLVFTDGQGGAGGKTGRQPTAYSVPTGDGRDPAVLDRACAEMTALIAAAMARAEHVHPIVSPTRWPAERARPYDVMVVGAGFAGAVMAERLAAGSGKRVLVVDRHLHLGGSTCDGLDEEGRPIERAPQVFRTAAREVADYVSRFTAWAEGGAGEPAHAFAAVPAEGYTRLFERMLDHPNIEVLLGVDYAEARAAYPHGQLVFTGAMDEYFDFRLGNLPGAAGQGEARRRLSRRYEALAMAQRDVTFVGGSGEEDDAGRQVGRALAAYARHFAPGRIGEPRPAPAPTPAERPRAAA